MGEGDMANVSRLKPAERMGISMHAVIAIFLGGGLGAVARHLVSQAMVRPDQFPMGTLTVNIVGCFLIGVFATAFGQLADVSQTLRLALMVGFLGGFTTFSSFGLDTIKLLNDGRFMAAGGYILASNAVGLLAVWVGMKATRGVMG